MALNTDRRTVLDFSHLTEKGIEIRSLAPSTQNELSQVRALCSVRRSSQCSALSNGLSLCVCVALCS